MNLKNYNYARNYNGKIFNFIEIHFFRSKNFITHENYENPVLFSFNNLYVLFIDGSERYTTGNYPPR